ncbi:phage tail protein [Pseudoalteromonas sp.]|uniref:phage tail-collar fiber domain-containing protein n=1 Tax=Pseudoalteromonas sp. TaxID=53249 RepID=UPI0023564ADD|nr:phage tail protein [Pseudoalteromonas sp.]
MTVIKNSISRLKSGERGESAAQVNAHLVQFTRVSVGDANNALPAENPERTALDNHVTDGEIVSHKLDKHNDTQRILQLRIGPDANYDARELLIYATANGIEFPHSYVRLGSAYPVRTAENGGIQILINAIIKVSSKTGFNITVQPATDYISRAEFDGHVHEDYLKKSAFNASLPFVTQPVIKLFNRHNIIDDNEYTAPLLGIKGAELQNNDWFSVRASNGQPVIKSANEDEATAKFKRLADGAIDTQVNIVADDKNERVFVYNKIDNVWEF